MRVSKTHSSFIAVSVLLAAFHVSSCSSASEISSAGTSNSDRAKNVSANSNQTTQNTPVEIAVNKPPTNAQDIVKFDGKDYTRKTGWKIPSQDGASLHEKETDTRTTETGKQVKMTTAHYSSRYDRLPSYTEDFYFEGSKLDYMKGKRLEIDTFMKMSVRGKVFMYSISVGKVGHPPASNGDPHDDPFGYRILDKDGDGIFETLLHGKSDIIVPNWVLK